MDDNNILLKEFPIVCPKPFSNGSATTLAIVLSSLLVISSLFGLIKRFPIFIYNVCVSLHYTLLLLVASHHYGA